MGPTITVTERASGPGPTAPPGTPSRRTVGQRLWIGVSSASAAVFGLLPHVLHHVGLFAGALFAGVGGSLIFGALGFLAAIPFLRRVHRQTGTWRVPSALLVLFAVVFSISTFVIGPAINGSDSQKSSSGSSQTAPGPAQKDASGQTAPDPAKKDAHGH